VTSKTRIDGLVNFLSGLGSKKDRTQNTHYSGGIVLDRQTLDDMYRHNGFAKKIVDIPAKEMTRQWITIENDDENIGLQKLDALGAKTIFRDALKWGRLFGGALIVMGIDDGGALEQPVREAAIRDVTFLRVYDRHQISWQTADISDDPNSEYYGLPEFYTISAYNTAKQFRVHASRVLRHGGIGISERSRAQNDGWGDSVLQAIYDELRDYGIIKSSSVNIVQDFVQTLLQIDNLSEMLSTKDGEDVVRKRLDLIDMSRSVLNTILLDGEEQYTKQSSTVTGLDKLIEQFALALSGVTGIPVTKLFGQAPAGLNASGDNDVRNFYDDIKSSQEEELLPMLQRLHYLIMKSLNGGYKGQVNAEANIEFVPLWQMTDQQDADWKYKIAQTDEIYVRNGVANPEEIAVSRFSGGFNPDTTIDPSMRKFEELNNAE